jgi:protocatechuate 3,4-dioxygenase beta subunit
MMMEIANYFGNNVSVLANNGDGTFAPHITYATDGYPISVFASDLDGDGDIDLAATNLFSDNVSVLLNVDSPGLIFGTVTDTESQPIESVYVELNTAALTAGRYDNIKPIKNAKIDNTGSTEGGILLDVVDSVYTDENGYYEFTVDAGTYDLLFSHPDYNDTTCAGVVVARGDTTVLDVQITLAGCDYAVGDINGSANYNGLDITYGVNFFKYGTPEPQCSYGSCPIPPCDAFFYCGDVNASCNYNGLDITYGVNYFKYGSPAPNPCGDCPPQDGIAISAGNKDTDIGQDSGREDKTNKLKGKSLKSSVSKQLKDKK